MFLSSMRTTQHVCWCAAVLCSAVFGQAYAGEPSLPGIADDKGYDAVEVAAEKGARGTPNCQQRAVYSCVDQQPPSIFILLEDQGTATINWQGHIFHRRLSYVGCRMINGGQCSVYKLDKHLPGFPGAWLFAFEISAAPSEYSVYWSDLGLHFWDFCEATRHPIFTETD